MSLSEIPNLPTGVRLQRLPPKSRRVRNPPPEWEVQLEGERIGQIEQWKVDSASAIFYRATAFHPETGQAIPLESNTDLAERVEKVVEAWRDPTRFLHKASWE
jgi:hypothetical protein